MKHRILIEFEASKPLPADFTDMVLNRVYALDCVDKVECTATLVGDVLKDAERMDWLESSKEHHAFCHTFNGEYRYYAHQLEGYATVRETIDAAKDTQ